MRPTQEFYYKFWRLQQSFSSASAIRLLSCNTGYLVNSAVVSDKNLLTDRSVREQVLIKWSSNRYSDHSDIVTALVRVANNSNNRQQSTLWARIMGWGIQEYESRRYWSKHLNFAQSSAEYDQQIVQSLVDSDASSAQIGGIEHGEQQQQRNRHHRIECRGLKQQSRLGEELRFQSARELIVRLFFDC